MTNEFNEYSVTDEIDRLFVVYDKAKEYLQKILDGIEQQIKSWEYRREIILDRTKSVSSDFLLPKTNRINELAIDVVQALCRADLLIEQVLRIDPKLPVLTHPVPKSTSFSARTIDSNISYSMSNPSVPRFHHPATSPSLNSINQQQQLPYMDTLSNGRTAAKSVGPMPVLRTSQSTAASRMTLGTTQEKSGFKPIEQQRPTTISDTTPRPTPIHLPTAHYGVTEGNNLMQPMSQNYSIRTSQSELIPSPMGIAAVNPPRAKVEVKLQRIPYGTKWKQAHIEVIDSLSAFYVINADPKVQDKFRKMLSDLNDYYSNLEDSNKLLPLDNIGIGDFGVAKFSEDNRWYRARVVMSEEQDSIRIVFIDFGNIETKHISEFFPLDKSYADLPAQAIACTLSDAFPRAPIEDSIWPQETVQFFREAVTDTTVEVTFTPFEEGIDEWPLHFVRITVGNQTVTNLLNLKQRIEPRPNRFIAEQLASSLSPQEYILFNIPIDASNRSQ